MPEINGIAHLQLCVSDMARSKPFYSKLLTSMGMFPAIESDTYLYYVGGKTAVAITPASRDFHPQRFEQGRVGLHHLCFRARSREDVDAFHAIAEGLAAKIIRKAEEGHYAPGYYSTLFEDPNGIRIEINFVPGKGLLKNEAP